MSEALSVQLKRPEALFLLLSAKLNHEFLESLQIEDLHFGEAEMGALIQKLEQVIGPAMAELSDEILEELINSFLPEVPIRTVATADYSFPMYSTDETMPKLQSALQSNQVLKLEYYSMDREEINSREVEPYGLDKRYNHHILLGYCRWREDIRLFRVDRIKSVEILPEHFTKPENFEAEAYSDDEYV